MSPSGLGDSHRPGEDVGLLVAEGGTGQVLRERGQEQEGLQIPQRCEVSPGQGFYECNGYLNVTTSSEPLYIIGGDI